MYIRAVVRVGRIIQLVVNPDNEYYEVASNLKNEYVIKVIGTVKQRENPNKNFMPCPGKITGLHLPGGNGLRIDSGIYQGYTIPFNYDSMIAKIIVHGNTRNEAIAKMKRALEELVIEGVDTNADFIYEIIRNPDFIRGDFDTSFISKNFNK